MKTVYRLSDKEIKDFLTGKRLQILLTAKMRSFLIKVLCEYGYKLRNTIESEDSSVEERKDALNEYIAKEKIMEQLRIFED